MTLPLMGKVRRRAVAILAAPASLLCFAAAALGLPPFTTAPKSSASSGGQAELFGVAAGCHPTYDRFVIRARSARPGYDARYVKQIIADPSGRPVPLRGANRIRVIVRDARGHTSTGANLLPGVLTPLCPNLRQVRKAGDFEGVVSFGLGVNAKAGFRVFRLTGPSRVVIDVAH